MNTQGTNIAPHTWAVRASAGDDAHVSVYTGKTTMRVGAQVAFEPVDPPTATELFVGAVAADLVQGFRRAARRSRIAVENVELSLEYFLENPLVHFRVVGEEGTPALRQVSGTLYAQADLSDDRLSDLWSETLEGSPTYCTLAGTVDFRLRCRRV